MDDIVSYTGFSVKHDKINEYLRTPSARTLVAAGGEARAKAYADSLNQQILDAPRVGPLIVYRGTGCYQAPVVDGRFTMKGFSGVSTDPSISCGFADSDCCLYQLELPDGTPALDLSKISKVDEKELLLPTHATFRFTGKKTVTVDGKERMIPSGVFERFYTFDEMDRTPVFDDRTRAMIRVRKEIHDRTTARLAELKSPKLHEQAEKWDKEVAELAKKYGISEADVRKGGATSRGTRKRTRRRRRVGSRGRA